MVRANLHAESRYGGSRLPVLLALVLLIGGGVLAYRHFFERPGEAAINLIPEDALFVATLDTTPSPAQVPVFRQISAALQQEQAGSQFDSFVTSLLSNSPIATKLRPYLSNSFAGAALKGASGKLEDADWVLLAALKDSGSAHDVLEQNATKQSLNGLDYYKVGQEKTCLALMSDYLVIAEKPEVLARIAAVHRGDTASVTHLEGFQEARAALPTDANLMLFAAPELLKEMGNGLAEMNRSATIATQFQTTHWMAIGAAIHNGGIDTVMQWPMSPPAGVEGTEVSHIAALDPQLLKKLPGGAYGMMAASQPGKYWNWITSAANRSPDAQRSLNEGIAKFEHETGMSVPRDVLPGFYGDFALAVYPDADGSRHSVDGLILLDDANGGDPAALAARVRDYVSRESAREGRNPVQFVSEQRGNATIWSIDTQSQNQLRNALTGAVSSAQDQFGGPPAVSGSSMSSMPPMPNATAPGQNGTDGIGNGANSNGNDNSGADNGVGNGDVNNGNNSSDNSDSNDSSNDANNADRSSGTHNQGNDTGSATDSFALPATRGNAAGAGGSIDRSDTQSAIGHLHQETIYSVGPGGTSVVTRNIPEPVVSNHSMTSPAATGNPSVQRAVANKTVVYAQVGHAILIASSQKMLDRALAAYTGGSGTLLDDPAYAQMNRQAPSGAQSLVMIDLPGIMEELRPTLTNALSGNHAGITPDDIIGMFGHNTGILCTYRYDGKLIRASCYMPLDYAKYIHMIGAFGRSMRGATSPAPSASAPGA